MQSGKTLSASLPPLKYGVSKFSSWANAEGVGEVKLGVTIDTVDELLMYEADNLTPGNLD